ncbi:hypothetical protein C4F50_01105 [Flavobacterium sp. KB82]|uniref:Uncharacterized protein n=2 Tax=Flavobacterium hungaricum TaxID=2082725 RepID=A0ABR9TDV1_9FLAO|nr:hypothetical protein [Flavobacterium hungaricum]
MVIADLKAAYDFNAKQRKDLKKSLKASGIENYNSNGVYQDLIVVQENLYNALQNRINAIKMIW